MTGRLHTTAEVAAYCRMSERWVLDRCRNGAPHYDTGRGYRFTQAHIDALLATLERGAKPEVTVLSARQRRRRAS